MNVASVAILLISADYLASEFIQREEVSHLLKRQNAEGLRIIPVIIKPCAWLKVDWLSRIRAFPKDGSSLSFGGEDQIDAGLTEIAEEVSRSLSHSTLAADLPGSVSLRFQIDVECADVVDFSCDVLVLKYAQYFYGADLKVAELLKRTDTISPAPGEHVL